jgi:hypothetical protein
LPSVPVHLPVLKTIDYIVRIGDRCLGLLLKGVIEMEHIAIQKASLVTSTDRPDTGILCRLYKSRKPPFESVGRGHTVYLKLSNESFIKWRARVQKFKYVEADYDDIEKVRKMTEGFPIYDDPKFDDFWREHRNYRFGTIIWLENVEEIEPIYPKTRSHGSAWIVLDTDYERREWLGDSGK